MSALRHALALAAALATMATVACDSEAPGQDEGHFSSNEAVLLKFSFDGEATGLAQWGVERMVEKQLLYTVGQLNGDRALGRLEQLVLSNVERTMLPGGESHVRYHAELPVAWGNKTEVPERYQLTLPLRADNAGFEAFTEKYHERCVDGGHDVDRGSMWYYFRPQTNGCELAAEDVTTLEATVSLSSENTEGKYPEYHRVWDDEELKVVAIFGKFWDGSTRSYDPGIRAYREFLEQLRERLASMRLTTVPAALPEEIGFDTPEVVLHAVTEDGRKVEVVALLVDSIMSAGLSFNQRYRELSGDADVIIYNGHAGLGANVRALAKRGRFKPQKYQIFFMNGCDSFTYVDGQLAKTRALLNPDDPSGTRFMDMITNVMPVFFSEMSGGSLALFDGLLSYQQPKSYQRIFESVGADQVVVVTGEEDNAYVPGYRPAQSQWAGFDDVGQLATGASKAYALGELPAGTYVVSTAQGERIVGGDVDLYVALGRAPSHTQYDFRSQLDGSNESVTLHLEQPAEVHVMVRGFASASGASASAYTLRARAGL